MKILKFFVLFLVVSLIFGIGKAFKSDIDDFKIEETRENGEIIQEDEKVFNEEITKPIIDEITTEKNESKNEANKFDVNSTTKKILKTEPIITQKTEKITTKKITTTTSKKNDEENKTTQPMEKTTSKKVQIWEALGMSEEDYKYKPAFAGDRVDFKNYEECFNHGYAYEPYLNGEETFNCSEVISLSGNFLGIMFKTEKNIKDKS